MHPFASAFNGFWNMRGEYPAHFGKHVSNSSNHRLAPLAMQREVKTSFGCVTSGKRLMDNSSVQDY
jgi:hypothetical protein